MLVLHISGALELRIKLRADLQAELLSRATIELRAEFR